MPPVLSTERIAHLGTAGDCRAAAFQSSLCRSGVRTDKTHCEHNESGYPSIADMREDIRKPPLSRSNKHAVIQSRHQRSAGSHDRQLRRLDTLEDTGGIDADLTPRIRNVGSVALISPPTAANSREW